MKRNSAKYLRKQDLKKTKPAFRDVEYLIIKSQGKAIAKKPVHKKLPILDFSSMGFVSKSVMKSGYKYLVAAGYLAKVQLNLFRLNEKIIRCKNIECDLRYNKDFLSISKLKDFKWAKTKGNIKNIRTLHEIFKKTVEFAKKKNIKKIFCDTWIFYEHPKIAEKLGFKLFNINSFNKFIKENNISKILGLTFANKLYLLVLDKKGKKRELQLSKKVSFPRWVKTIS